MKRKVNIGIITIFLNMGVKIILNYLTVQNWKEPKINTTTPKNPKPNTVIKRNTNAISFFRKNPLLIDTIDTIISLLIEFSVVPS